MAFEPNESEIHSVRSPSSRHVWIELDINTILLVLQQTPVIYSQLCLLSTSIPMHIESPNKGLCLMKMVDRFRMHKTQP